MLHLRIEKKKKKKKKKKKTITFNLIAALSKKGRKDCTALKIRALKIQRGIKIQRYKDASKFVGNKAKGRISITGV